MFDRIFQGALGVALLVVLGGCSEQVTGALGCPQLCSDQSVQLRDTVLVGSVDLAATFIGFPRLGAPSTLSLVAQGDTDDARVVARFDSLKTVYRVPGATADSSVTRVDSASLIFVLDTTLARPTVPVRIEAFDVDTTADDTVPRALLPLFRADRSLGSRTFSVAEVKDTLRLPISNAAVRGKIVGLQRLRIGLRVFNGSGGSEAVRLRISRAVRPIVRYRVSADTLVAPDTILPNSSTPSDFPSIAAGFRVYSIIASGALATPSNDLIAVGGLAGARSYLRFVIPAIVLDSVRVIGATLQLTQLPSRAQGGRADTLRLLTHPVFAGPMITDLFTASQYIGPPVDTLKLVPRDSGRRDIELVNLVLRWRALGTTNTTRAIVLRAAQEGDFPGELDFYSTQAPVSLQPKLRITYVPRRGFGLP